MICYQIWERARNQWQWAFAECLRDQRDFFPFTYWSA